MERSNSQTTYCSEAEEALMHNSDKSKIGCHVLRRSNRLSQKPENFNRPISWENKRLTSKKYRPCYKKSQQAQNSEDSSQFLTEKIDDCSLQEDRQVNDQSNRSTALDDTNNRYGINLKSIDLIAELETQQFFDSLPQNQLMDSANMVRRSVASEFPLDLRKHFRSSNVLRNEDALELDISSRDRKVDRIMRKRKIFNTNEDAKFQKIEDADINEKNKANIPNIKNGDNISEPLNQISYSAQLTGNGNPLKRQFSISQPIDDQPIQKKKKSVVSAQKQSNRGRKRKKFINLSSFVLVEPQHNFKNTNANVRKEETINENILNRNNTQLLPATNLLQTDMCHLNVPGKRSTPVPDIEATCEQTSLKTSSFGLQKPKNLVMQVNADKQKNKISSAQNISEKSKCENIKNTSKIKKHQYLGQQNKKTTNTFKNLLTTSKDQEPMTKISTKEETIYGHIPKITTIPLLPATTDSLLPKVYPPHFTGQLPAPIPEPVSVRQLKNAANFNDTQLILNSDRELNYWLTPEQTQTFDEEVLSPSTPSLSDSLKSIFESDNLRDILHIEKIIYRLEDNHVKALAMVLNIETEILHKILKHIVRLDENILKNVNNMMKVMSLPVNTFEITDSFERVEPSVMVTSPISSLSVELIESPKIRQSRIFQSQRNPNKN